jgi:A/G-specific adenine glycosylase
MSVRIDIPVGTRLAVSPASLSSKQLPAFRRALLRWYDRHRRDLPWRNTHDPYRIWLSEIMLQQTRVAAVLDHYLVFLERFPQVEALAAAPQEAVLAAWSGLGYYRRASMLHQCAKEIVHHHRGRFPRTAEALRTLPGIGHYTAAALASIAFGEPVAVVDGNVERVVQRLTGYDLARQQIWRHAESLLSASRPGDFNQSMMELGATVCLPRDPKCPTCPLRKWCATWIRLQRPQRTTEPRASSPVRTPTAIPNRKAKKEIRCVLDERDGHICLVQRPRKSSLMPGMWELPLLPENPDPTPVLVPWRTFRHSITSTDFTVHVHRAPNSTANGEWLPVAGISLLPITGLTRKILRAASII